MSEREHNARATGRHSSCTQRHEVRAASGRRGAIATLPGFHSSSPLSDEPSSNRLATFARVVSRPLGLRTTAMTGHEFIDWIGSSEKVTRSAKTMRQTLKPNGTV